MPDIVLTETKGAVRIITMNRPDKLNALNTELTSALLDALHQADGDSAINAIVLTGAGRAFCVGADLSEFATLTAANPDAVQKRADLTMRLHMAFPKLGKPVIAAARGHAVGGGAGLCLACDLVIADPTLKLGYPETRHGIVAAIVMTNLVRQVGRKKAFELVSLGQSLSASEAEELGMINLIAAEDRLMEAALSMAEHIAKIEPEAMRATKELFYRVTELPYADAMQAGREVNEKMRGFRKAKP